MEDTSKLFGSYTQLGDVATISTACLYPLQDWPNDTLEPVGSIDKITEGSIVLTDTKYVKISEREMLKFRLRHGDIVFNNRTSAKNIGKSARFDLKEPVLHTKYLRIRAIPELDSRFLQFVLERYKAEGRLRSITKLSSNLSIITLSDLNTLRIPCPPMPVQIQLLSWLDSESETERLDLSYLNVDIKNLTAAPKEVFLSSERSRHSA